MNRFPFTFVLGLCLVSTIAWAENSSAPVVGDGYGDKVVIAPGVDLTGIDRSYLQAPDIKDLRQPKNPFYNYPVWHPDGRHILFTDITGIYMAPVNGGQPRLLFDNYYIHTDNGVRYVLNQMIQRIAGISPDGRKLYFTRNLIGEGSGATISIVGGGESVSISGGTPTLECLDMATGAITGLARNVYKATLSQSGEFVFYYDTLRKVSVVKDLLSGEERNPSFEYAGGVSVSPVDKSLPFSGGVSFTPDDQYIVYSQKMIDSSFQLFKAPVNGGAAVQISSNTGDSAGWFWALPDCSPIADWALYTDESKEMLNYEYNDGSGVRGGSWRAQKVRAFNLRTGTAYDILPASPHINTNQGQFSRDGRQFCYVMENYMAPSNETRWALYIQDISLPSSLDFQLSVTDSPPKGFALTGNSPNPFNPSTHISFTLPSAGTVQMSVYDVTGRLVRNLVSAAMTTGAHEMVWDGRDDSGQAVSSGTYIARLKMGNFTASHRMMLLK